MHTNSMKSLFEKDVQTVKSATKMKRFSRAQPLHPNWGRDHRQNTGEALNRQSYSNHLRNGDLSVFVGITDYSSIYLGNSWISDPVVLNYLWLILPFKPRNLYGITYIYLYLNRIYLKFPVKNRSRIAGPTKITVTNFTTVIFHIKSVNCWGCDAN